jgi:AraC-like DNA-binding protein
VSISRVDSQAEHAIAAFERLHRLLVTVHDLRGDLWHQVDPHRLVHRSPLCRAVKSTAQGEFRCKAFEMDALRADLARSGTGRYHVCHAGLVEWVAPMRSPRGLDWVLFAGLRRVGSGLGGAWRDPQSPTRAAWPNGTQLPQPVDDAEAVDILEALHALAARLDQLRRDRPRPEREVRQRGAGDGEAHRAARIARFLAQRHTEPVRLGDLARELGLSEDRTGREVRRLHGNGFAELLAEARLITAATLLRSSSLPVLEVGQQAGFGDASHFHACFRNRFGCSPGAWRLAADMT